MIEFIVKYWIEIFFGLITSFILFLYRRIGIYFKIMNATKNGVKILLKNEIIKEYKTFSKNNCINFYEKNIILELHKEYKNLGGNGMIEDIINDINDLPLKDNCGGD